MLSTLSTAQLVAIHNTFAAQQVGKFQTRAKAEARVEAVLAEANVTVRNAVRDTFGLTGKKLELLNMMQRKAGVSEREACEAFGWVECGATIARVRQAAEDMGFKVERVRGKDGLTRYRVIG